MQKENKLAALRSTIALRLECHDLNLQYLRRSAREVYADCAKLASRYSEAEWHGAPIDNRVSHFAREGESLLRQIAAICEESRALRKMLQEIDSK